MTVEPDHEPNEWESASRPTPQSTSGSGPAAQSVQYNSARHGSHVEESPELLRWRADLLMDEMMMGGVDVSAADGNRTFSGVDSPVVQRPQRPANGGTVHSDPGRTPRDDYARRGDEDAGYTNGVHPYGQHHPADSMSGNYQDAPAQNDFSSDPARHVEPRDADTHFDNISNDNRYDARERDRHADEWRADEGAPGRYAPDHSYDDAHSIEPRHATPPEARSHRSYAESPRPAEPTPLRDDSYDRGNERDSSESRASAPSQFSGRSSEPPMRREDESRTSHPVADERSSSLRTTMDGAPVASSDDQTARTDRLYALEQQYEQFRREQSANIQPTTPTPPPADSRPPLSAQPSRAQSSTSPAPPRVTPQPVDEHTQWASGADKWEYQDFSANPDEEDGLFPNGYPAPEHPLAQDRAVRHDPAQYVSAMSVMGNKKRSTLLPRMSELNVDTLHREISDLHGEIAALLPVGNETGERARHLLDKAYSILQSDPMRSAEVEYYMQQVRAIVLRLHQARQWSDLYRQRLHVYLWGWLGLSAVVVVASFLFQTGIEEALMWMLGVDRGSLLVSHWATFIGTAFAGALGGAIGALYTMQAHARGEYSFFDRKYGLRGLILPFMGLIVGALGYLIFGAIFALLGIDPSQSLTAAIVPTTAAFAFGFSQESIYGTRN